MPPHPLVHGFVGKLVGFLVATAKGMAHLKPLELAGEALGFFPQRAEAGTGDLVLTLHLLHHQLGVRDHPQPSCTVLLGPGKNGDKPFVFSEIIGLAAEELA